MLTFRCVFRTKAATRSFLRAVRFYNESGCWVHPSHPDSIPISFARNPFPGDYSSAKFAVICRRTASKHMQKVFARGSLNPGTQESRTA